MLFLSMMNMKISLGSLPPIASRLHHDPGFIDPPESPENPDLCPREFRAFQPDEGSSIQEQKSAISSQV